MPMVPKQPGPSSFLGNSPSGSFSGLNISGAPKTPQPSIGGAANVAPPGWEATVRGMKKHHEISNPFALAWWMKDQGDTPHK